MARSMAFLTGMPSGASSPLRGRSAPSLITPMVRGGPPPTIVQPARLKTTRVRQESARRFIAPLPGSIGSDPQIGALNVWTLEQVLGCPFLDDPPCFQDVASGGDPERLQRV